MKKIPIIRPLLIDDNFVTYIQMKANVFNKFFAKQCTPLKNSRLFPANQMFLKQSRLNSVNFNKDEILKIIRALNIHKAHGLILLFENSTKSSCYPDI